jgi:antirestriction protein ArdC
MSNEQTPKQDVYAIVTNRIIEKLEQKIIPWRQPWTDAGIPRNLITKNAYRGINTWLLASAGYEKNFFLSFKQVQELGAKVKRGEKSEMVVFWKTVPKEEADKESENNDESTKQKVVLRYYSVFNVSQCDGLPEGIVPAIIDRPNAPIKTCEDIIRQMPSCPLIQHKEMKAWYDVATDIINMPKRKSFESSELFYSTLFHEIVHSTGHEKRLNRKELTARTIFGSPTYSLEELCAEIGACYLKSIAGIEDKDFEESIGYINGWLTQLKKDKRFIFYASSNAQKAVDYIFNRKTEEQESIPHTEPEELQSEIV